MAKSKPGSTGKAVGKPTKRVAAKAMVKQAKSLKKGKK